MFYEKRVNSFPGLMREVELLDLDSGIRGYVTYNGKRQFMFVTRSARGYTLMVYGRLVHGRAESPGGRLLVKEFKTEGGLRAFVQGMIERPVRAFVY